MDSALAAEVKEPAEESHSESLAVKRPVENGGCDELVKRPKVEGAASSGELKRVAETVLVLSTMAAIRGGRKPADVEIELMKEARMKLVELCQGLAPKDIVATEAIGTVIEELGLNGKMKDQRLGFQTTKMSIAERFSHTKLKVRPQYKRLLWLNAVCHVNRLLLQFRVKLLAYFNLTNLTYILFFTVRFIIKKF